jgi:hypothetical protein
VQAINGHANQLGDLLSIFSSLEEIPDLLDSFRGKLYQPSTSRELRSEGLGLQHFFYPFSAVDRRLSGAKLVMKRHMHRDWRRRVLAPNRFWEIERFPALRAIHATAYPWVPSNPVHLPFILVTLSSKCYGNAVD